MTKPKNVHLIVETLSGRFEGDFETDQKLQDVIDKAFLSLEIKPAPGSNWELRYQDVLLAPQKTIEEQHIPNRAVLTLALDEGGGG